MVILFFLFCGIISAGITFYCYRLYLRHRFNYLLSLLFYMISAVIYGFLNWVGPELIYVTMKGMPRQTLVNLATLQAFMAIPVMIAKIYYLMKFTLEMLTLSLTRSIKKAFFIFAAIFSIVSVWTFAKRFFSPDGLSLIILFAMGIAAVGIHLYFNLVLAVRSKNKPVKKERSDSRGTGLFFFGGFLFYVLSAYVFIIYIDGLDLAALLYFIVLIPPPVFLGLRLRSSHTSSKAENTKNEKLERFAVHYRLTEREREIIELVIQGKSNQEIEEKLFIALQTVKNTLSKIYKKLGESSRVKVIKKFTDFK